MPFLFGNCITIFSLLIFGNAGVFCDGCGCTECKICLCLYSKLGTMSEINGVLEGLGYAHRDSKILKHNYNFYESQRLKFNLKFIKKPL